MAAIRRAPKEPTVKKPKPKVKAPLHQRILGRPQAELDTIDDLEIELEHALKHDHIEYDSYLDCWEVLDLRRAKAKEQLAKATGRYVKPQKVVDIPVRVVKQKAVKRYKPWQIKCMIVVCALVFLKIMSLKP